MPKIIEVRFLAQYEQGDLFVRPGLRKKYYVRKETSEESGKRVTWHIANKHEEEYELGATLKAGVSIRVVTGKRKNKITYFEETVAAISENASATHAEKTGDFAQETLTATERRIQRDRNLLSSDEWADRLFQLSPQYGYTGYPDNWLRFGTDKLESETEETVDVMGTAYQVVSTLWKHKICNLSWKVYEIFNKHGECISLIGYEFLP